jgi:CheY-like chemotaxis protein
MVSKPWKKVKEKRIDLILLDIQLPKMDGMEVLLRLKSNPQTQDIPVVALTAHSMRGDENVLSKQDVAVTFQSQLISIISEILLDPIWEK